MCSVVCAPSPPPLAASRAGPPKPLEQLEREICELSAHIAAATCRWLTLLAEFDERRGWAEWGVYSCAHWLSWRCSVSPRSAREHVRVARALVQLPQVQESFAAGELSYSKVRALTRVATAENESYLLQLAQHATGGQLDRIVRSYRGVLRATREHAQQTIERRALRYEWQEDGSLRLEATLPADDGALVLAALEAAGRAASDEDDEDDRPTPSARRADALVTVARAALADGLEGSAGADRAIVMVHVDAQTLAAEDIHERCELEEGPPLAPETARRLSCEGSVVRILERDGRPLSIGRRTRVISPALRRALRSRDGGCRFPGCSHQRFLHAHHIQHWAHGGPTALSNLIQLCSHHHRLVHEGGFTVESGADGGTTFRRPDGRTIPAVPVPCRPRGPDLVERHRQFGLVVHGRTCMPRSAGDRCDYSLAMEGLLTADGLMTRPGGGP